MPRFIGCAPPEGARDLATATISPGMSPLVRLTYSQMRLMPHHTVFYRLDTSDRGGKGRYAKRWYRWYSTRVAIESNANATPSMKKRAAGV